MENRSQELFFRSEWLNCFAPEIKKINLEHNESFLEAYFILKQKFGFKTAHAISFTPFNAVITHSDPLINQSTQFNYELKLLHELTIKLLDWDAVNIKFKINQLNMPRINDKKIVSKNNYTEILRSPIISDSLWNQLSSENRNKISSAQKNSEIIEFSDVNKIVDSIHLNHNYYKDLPDKEILSKFFHWAIAHSYVKSFACASRGKILSVSVFIKSLDTIYYLFNYNDKSEQIRGRHLALIWEGIKWACESQCHFNFDGSQLEEIAKVFKSFCTETIIYPNVYYIKNPILRIIQKLK